MFNRPIYNYSLLLTKSLLILQQDCSMRLIFTFWNKMSSHQEKTCNLCSRIFLICKLQWPEAVCIVSTVYHDSLFSFNKKLKFFCYIFLFVYIPPSSMTSVVTRAKINIARLFTTVSKYYRVYNKIIWNFKTKYFLCDTVQKYGLFCSRVYWQTRFLISSK